MSETYTLTAKEAAQDAALADIERRRLRAVRPVYEAIQGLKAAMSGSPWLVKRRAYFTQVLASLHFDRAPGDEEEKAS